LFFPPTFDELNRHQPYARFFMNAIDRNIVAAKRAQPGVHCAESHAAQRRWPIRYQAIEPLAMLADVIAILASCLLAAALNGSESRGFGKALGAAIVIAALFVCLLKMKELYRPQELLALRNQARAVAIAWTQVFVLLAAAVGALDMGHNILRGASLLAAIGPCALILLRAALKRVLVKGLSGRRFAGRRVVLITDQPKSSTTGLEHTLATLGFTVAWRFALPPAEAGLGFRKRLGASVIGHVSGSDVEEIFIEADLKRWPELRALAGDLRVLPSHISFAPAGPAAEAFRRPSRAFGGDVCVEFQRGPQSQLEYAAKRTLDLVAATLALALFSPVLAAAALAIKLESRGPVLFRQKRCGFNGRGFTIRKFRTMRVLEDGAHVVQALPSDTRVTRVGKWLRRTSIDELPQLLNVLDGSMSLVGPRPHALAHESQFDKVVRNYAFRRRVKPGLTGWAQVHGCRGPTPTLAAIERRVEYDLWYIDNWSLRLDLAILLQTPIEILRGRNAF
jgi:Undecaprenyl-phosphate glucose phosphotransferase